MRIAIFGSYNHGNYGDDLMAIIYGKILKDLGHEVLIYRFAEDLAEKYGFGTTNSLNDLIENSKLCIIGGGAFLSSTGLPINDVFYDIEEKCLELKRKCEQYNCPVYGVSIGGEGFGDRTALGFGRSQLFSSEIFKGASVRLPADVKLLNYLKKDVVYFPDILWQTSNFWKQKHNNEKKFNVGINLETNDLSKYFIYNLLLLQKITLNSFKITFFRVHRPQYNLNYEFFITNENENISNCIYSEPESFIEVLCQQDLIISSKLHLGLTALSYKIPFISVSGHDKTISFLKSLNFDGNIIQYGRKKILRLLLNIVFNKKEFSLSHEKENLIDNQINNSKGHLEYLKNILSNISVGS